MTRSLIIILFFCGTLIAQEKKEAAPGRPVTVDETRNDEKKSDPSLPKIELPEFVITGKEVIDLSVSTKSGFDEEKIFVPSAPHAGSRVQPIGSSYESKQSKIFSKQPDPLNGKIFAGMGFFTTPDLNGWFGTFDRSNAFIMNGHYQSSEGHVKDGEWWKGGVGMKGKYEIPDSSEFLPGMQSKMSLAYDRNAYRAFASPAPNRVRDLSAFEMTIGVGSRYALPYQSWSQVEYTGSIGWSRTTANDSLRSSESALQLKGSAAGTLFGIGVKGAAEYELTAYDIPVVPPLEIHSGHWGTVRIEGKSTLSTNIQVGFSLTQYVYRGSFGATHGRLYPQIDMQYFIMEGVSFSFDFQPQVQKNTLESAIEKNRYMSFSSPLQHSDMPVVLHTGMDVRLGESWSLSGGFGYFHINNYLTFLDSNNAKVWEVIYLSGVRATRFDLALTYRPDDRSVVKSYIASESQKAIDSSASLPFVPQFSAGAVYSYAFDIGINLEATMEYIGNRYSDYSLQHTLAGYLATRVRSEYAFSSKFKAFIVLENILNHQYYKWNGYRERSLFLMMGASYSW